MLKIVFSYPTELPNEINLVNDLLATEVDYFHIRKPDYEENEFEKYIESIDEVYYHKLIIHSYYRFTIKYNLGGIHLNQKGLAALRTEEESDRCFIEPLLLKNKKILVNGIVPNIVSYSAHSFNDIHNVQFETDYITLSPIYDSISKKEYKSNFTDHKLLRTELKATTKKIIALGGVSPKNETELKMLGFSGFVILGDYWKDHLPKEKIFVTKF